MKSRKVKWECRKSQSTRQKCRVASGRASWEWKETAPRYKSGLQNLVGFESERVCKDIPLKFNIVTLQNYIFLKGVNLHLCEIVMGELNENCFRVESLSLLIT